MPELADFDAETGHLHTCAVYSTGCGCAAELYTLADVAQDAAVFDEIRIERARAHAKHGDTSMESQPVDDLMRLSILAEEVGEVARGFNDARHRGEAVDLAALRRELIQTAAMAVAWADACSRQEAPHTHLPNPRRGRHWHEHWGAPTFCERYCRPGFKRPDCPCLADHLEPSPPKEKP